MFRKNQPRYHYDNNEEPIVISKHTLDTLLAAPNPSDAIALYTFYYYTAKWQKTNQPKATRSYVQKALRMSEKRVLKAKKILKELKLIDDIIIKNKETGKFTGNYIKVNLIWCKATVNSTKNRSVNLEVAVQKTADSIYGSTANGGSNALMTNNKNALMTNNKKIYKKSFDGLNYFLKHSQGIFKDSEVTQAMQDYIVYRKEINKPIKTPQTITRILNTLKPYPKITIIAAIHKSIDCNWTGVFPESIAPPTQINLKYDQNIIEEE